MQPGCIGGLGVWDAIWWTRHGRGWEAVQWEEEEKEEQMIHLTVWWPSGSCLPFHRWVATVDKQSIPYFIYVWIESMIGSVIIILVPEMCTVDIFNPLFKHLINYIWRGQAHPRSQRSHVIGRRLGMGAAHWPGAARRVAPVRDPCLCSGQMLF